MIAQWTPQPGPQTRAVSCPCDITLFGGSRGGGKTDCLLGRQLIGAWNYRRHWNGLIVRRKYKDFAELRRRIDDLIAQGLPAERIGGDQQFNVVKFANGARFCMHAVQRLETVADHVGAQYTEIAIDEGTTFPFFQQMVDKLRGSLRSPHGVPCRMFVTGNPGGPGHYQVKSMLVDPVKPNTVFRDDTGETRVFIPSFLDDNRILCDNDPKYVGRLKAIKDPVLRKAWLDGDWDVFIGQAFDFQERYHVIDPYDVPQHAPLYSTFDWGFGRPFSWGWWWADNDGRLYRFAEWYGSTGTPNEGLRLTDSEIAEGINERERKLGIANRSITRLAGHDCFSRKPNYRGGGQGPSTAEVFAEHGIYLKAADPDRSLKFRQFRERLRVRKDDRGEMTELPMLVVSRVCKDFIRTVPGISVDQSNPEEIDTEQEDHALDEACQICMARRIGDSSEIVHGSLIERGAL